MDTQKDVEKTILNANNWYDRSQELPAQRVMAAQVFKLIGR